MVQRTVSKVSFSASAGRKTGLNHAGNSSPGLVLPVRKSKRIHFCRSLVFFLMMAILIPFSPVRAAQLELPSSWNPVGSGARALGMGGAFIAVADDATAASWNPGGLIQLERPEISVVGAAFERTEDNEFATNPEGNNKQKVSQESLNYFSLAMPFNLFDRNMIVSVNYQNLYNFNRQMDVYLDQSTPPVTLTRTINETHDGNVGAIGLAYAIRIVPKFSFGFTLNFWEDWLEDNEWEVNYHEIQVLTLPLLPAQTQSRTRISRYSFNGFNANLGFLFNITPNLTLGGVLKTPFKADVHKELTVIEVGTATPGTTHSQEDLSMDMPMSYGFAFAYRFSDAFTASFDVYRTEWDDFTQTDSAGNVVSPITSEAPGKFKIEETHQVRAGMEYLIINPSLIVPVRGGIFYDPAPAINHPDEYYGLSLGTGAIFKNFVLDIAYQYRFGNNVGRSIHQNFNFSQDTDEHTVYASAIVYF